MNLSTIIGPAAATFTIGLLGLLLRWWHKHGDIIAEFRKALDRGRIRENALTTVCEMLLYVIDGIPEPAVAVVELRSRALSVLEEARRQTHGKDDQ